MPITNQNKGNRVIIRHRGPQGRGIPAGGVDGQVLVKEGSTPFKMRWGQSPTGSAVAGPLLSVDGNLPLFDGITGKKLRDSGISVSSIARTTQLAAKVDKIAGKGLSTNDFTDAYKEKIDALQSTASFRGSFASLSAAEAATYSPLPTQGDFVLIESSGNPLQQAFWDDTNSTWSVVQDSVDMTGAEIAAVTFSELDTWDQDGCRIFTSAEKAQLAAHESLLNSIPGISTSATFGSISYFSLVGVAVTLSAASDGSTNLVKAAVTTSLTSGSSLFDNGGANDGTLRYIGTITKSFLVTAVVSVSGAGNDLMVYAIAKNDTLIPQSRVLESQKSTGTHSSVTLTAIVTMAQNDEITVLVGNTTDTSPPTVHTLTIQATAV